MATPAALLCKWLQRQLSEQNFDWFERQKQAVAADRALHLALGLAPRKLGKQDLVIEKDDLMQANEARPGWDPLGLSVDQAARLVFLLEAAAQGDGFGARFNQLCRTADAGELVVLYRGLPLYPDPSQLEAQAAEAARSHIRPVFEALAHKNPYPAEQFDDHRWNHMVLKALFIGSALDPIIGLDERANRPLAEMAQDYAHERWAAGREVSPELWRCTASFLDDRLLNDLDRVLTMGSARERQGAALALAASQHPGAGVLLAGQPDLLAGLKEGRLSWNSIVPGV